jgi:hypothetical protein
VLKGQITYLIDSVNQVSYLSLQHKPVLHLVLDESSNTRCSTGLCPYLLLGSSPNSSKSIIPASKNSNKSSGSISLIGVCFRSLVFLFETLPNFVKSYLVLVFLPLFCFSLHNFNDFDNALVSHFTKYIIFVN